MKQLITTTMALASVAFGYFYGWQCGVLVYAHSCLMIMAGIWWGIDTAVRRQGEEK